MSRWLSLRMFGVVLVATVMAGCGSAGDGTPPLPVGASLAGACPAGYYPLTLVPETDDEAGVVARTLACGDLLGRSVYLDNRSSSVWVIDGPAGIQRTD